MKAWLINAVWGLLGLVIAIQFVPINKTNPAVESDVPTPPEVKAILRRACYDCHSHETVWPWYSRTAPVSWLLASDVHEGRKEVNFSTWNSYQPQAQAKKRKEIRETLQKEDMPPWLYTVVHPQAQLSAQERLLLQQWAMPR